MRSAREDSDSFTATVPRRTEITWTCWDFGPPHAEAAGLLSALARRAGLRSGRSPAIIPVTAAAIAAEVGMPVTAEQVISGPELGGAAPPRSGASRQADRHVFARMSPEHKVQIVQTLERLGRVCAMVGDGTNDAAAIRAATVGIGVAAGKGSGRRDRPPTSCCSTAASRR